MTNALPNLACEQLIQIERKGKERKGKEGWMTKVNEILTLPSLQSFKSKETNICNG